MGNGGGQCIDSKGNQYTTTVVSGTANDLGCVAGGTDLDHLAAVCECLAKASNQTALLRGAATYNDPGGHGTDFWCVHESS